MSNNNVDYTCVDIANALIALFTYANFTGLIKQPKDSPLLQFAPQEPEINGNSVKLDFEFGNKKFTITISNNSDSE